MTGFDQTTAGTSSFPGVWADSYPGSDDLAKVQNAINDAYSTNKGIVWLDPRVYSMSGTLTVGSVQLRGTGVSGTRLHWPSDAGENAVAVEVTNPLGISRSPQIRDVEILGPNANGAFGVKQTLMDGVRLNTPSGLRDFAIHGFDKGLLMNAEEGHCHIEHFDISQNYYGVYFPTVGAGDGSDHVFREGGIGENKFAGVACPGNSGIYGAEFHRMHIGYQPYGIYQEDDATGSTGFMFMLYFYNVRSEFVGNAAIFSEKWDVGAAMSGCAFYEVDHTWAADKRINARPRDYAFQVGSIGMPVRFFSGPEAPKNGDLGAFHAGALQAPMLFDVSMNYSGGAAPSFVMTGGDPMNLTYISRAIGWARHGHFEIPVGQKSVTVTAPYLGPAASMVPSFTVTNNGGIASPVLRVDNASRVADPTTDSSSFTVHVSGGTPSGSPLGFYVSFL